MDMTGPAGRSRASTGRRGGAAGFRRTSSGGLAGAG